jgi:hypothetical protein
MIVNHVAAPQGVGEIEGLVEIDHQVDIVADRVPHCLYGREVVTWIGAAQPKLEGSEPSAPLVEQFDPSAAAESGDCSHSPLLL